MPLRIRIARQSLGAAVFATLVFGSSQSRDAAPECSPDLRTRGKQQHHPLARWLRRLQLKSGEVFEDDGPASGFSYKPNKETLSPRHRDSQATR